MKFTIYTRPGCPYCTKIKQVLGAKGFQYKEAVLGTDFNRDQFYAEFGQGFDISPSSVRLKETWWLH